MSIYQDVLVWSTNKPLFLRDALRRIIQNPTLSQNDIDELISLLKKEEGATGIALSPVPLDSAHLPSTENLGVNFPKLLRVRNPQNISALYSQADLQLIGSGLTVIYGNNGSGKSSYSRIFKKLCWSRQSSVDLKKNVFIPSPLIQQIEFTINENGTTTIFNWIENNPSHPSLSSINVFDSDCGNIYVNNENPTDYKPVGIDVLEKLIPILFQINQKLDSEIASYSTQKPVLNPNLIATNSGIWYNSLEEKERVVIDSYIQFSGTDITRKQELIILLGTPNPQLLIDTLNKTKSRIDNYISQFKAVEDNFNNENIQQIVDLRKQYFLINQAYNQALQELNNINSLPKIGSEHWRILWNSAKNYAVNAGMTDGEIFPSNQSLVKCVLCQQDLDENAQTRMLGFNEFVLNDISIQLNDIQTEINEKIKFIESINIYLFNHYQEIVQFIPNFEETYNQFVSQLQLVKTSIKNHLETGSDLNSTISTISSLLVDLNTNLDTQIKQNTDLLNNRLNLENEFKELETKEFLFAQKHIILQYYDEVKYIQWINHCKGKLNTTIISRKIGELMETQAVNLQHSEFISHLQYFNPELANKVAITRTRTSQGSTYQKCSFSSISDGLNSILSEGEQKIIALSNFLAECTIDNRKNTIIFDDPVNSLDIEYRELISKKIVELSVDRQVIVLTHDLSFMRFLVDIHKQTLTTNCELLGIDKYNGFSGIVTDEIPYLAKNIDERIASIRRILVEINALQIHEAHIRETKLDSARKRFRMLLERTVEEILSNKSYERFSKNIHLKKGNLSSYIITEQSDIDFILGLFSKYSVTEHDGGTSTIPMLPSSQVIEDDIRDYLAWKIDFKNRLRAFQITYN
jgi:energy-coupling factor transporter ATP-binding protein EcfA2